jgi:hypothetical protein
MKWRALALVWRAAWPVRPKSTMTNTPAKTENAEKSRKVQRVERLAEQLRANLKRRKAVAKSHISAANEVEVPKIPDEA